MKTRHRAREVALQVLYRYDTTVEAELPRGSILVDEMHHHFNHFQVPPESREFATELVAGTLLNRGELDRLLEKHAVNWKISRMSAIDRTLLRMAIYELQHFPEIPSSVTMDEAIEL